MMMSQACKKQRHFRKPQYCNPQQERGVALISMLLIFALVVIMISAAVRRDSLATRRTSQLLQHTSAQNYALTGETIARQRLAEDWLANENPDQNAERSDSLKDNWAKLDTFEFEGASIRMIVRDLHSCFNLNNLVAAEPSDKAADKPRPLIVNQRYVKRLNNLLKTLDIDEPDAVIEPLLNWLDSDLKDSNGGTEDTAAGQNSNANNLMVHISEWLMLLTPATRDKLTAQKVAAHICAAPLKDNNQTASLNPNTASIELLKSWEKNLDGDAIVAARVNMSAGYQTLNAFMSHNSTAGVALNAVDFSVNSEYFEAIIEVSFSEQHAYLISQLHRDPDSGKITTLGRSYSYGLVHQLLQTTSNPES